MSIRKHSPEFRLRVVKEAIESGNASEVARKYELNATMVGTWVRAYAASADTNAPLPQSKQRRSDPELKILGREALSEVERLRKIVAEQALEISILKDIKAAFEKKGL